MLRLNKYSEIDFDEYVRHLEHLGFLYYEYDSMSFVQRKMEQEIFTISDLVYRTMLECTAGKVIGTSRNNVIRFLTGFMGVPESLLYSQKRDSDSGETITTLSIDEKHLSKVYDKGYAKEFIDYYLSLKSKIAKNGYIKSCMSQFQDSGGIKNSKGNVLYKVTHSISQNATLRTYYKQFSHQQLAREALVSIGVPDGYTIVKGDFAQSDLKIVYNMLLRDKSNIDIMYNCEDSYEGIARICEGSEFNIEKFKEERHLYKENTLAPVYGAESAVTTDAQKIVNNVNSMLQTLPVYNEFKNRIKRKVECGLPVYVTTYFGNKIEIESTFKGSKEVIDAALNAPAQAGTSEIIAACANAIMRRFAKHGITADNGGIYLYLNRHDELVFLLNNKYLEYSWIFQDTEDILVDDWMPLKIEFSFSDNYAIDNPVIDNLCKSYYKEMEPLNVKQLIEKGRNCEFFIPCEDTLVLYCGTYSEGDRTVICFVNKDTDKVTYKEVNTSNADQLVKSIVQMMSEVRMDLFDKDITSVCIYTTLVVEDTSISKGIPVVFKRDFEDDMYRRVHELAHEKFNETL